MLGLFGKAFASMYDSRAGAGLARTGHGGASVERYADRLVDYAAIHRWAARDAAASYGTVSLIGASGAE